MSRSERRRGLPGRGFRRHELPLAEGGKLVLGTDGVISKLDVAGETVASWGRDDPDWPRHAIRFGLSVQAPTVAPPGARERRPRPPAA